MLCRGNNVMVWATTGVRRAGDFVLSKLPFSKESQISLRLGLVRTFISVNSESYFRICRKKPGAALACATTSVDASCIAMPTGPVPKLSASLHERDAGCALVQSSPLGGHSRGRGRSRIWRTALAK